MVARPLEDKVDDTATEIRSVPSQTSTIHPKILIGRQLRRGSCKQAQWPDARESCDDLRAANWTEAGELHDASA